MATDTLDSRASHIRGLTVTTLACVMGVVAALVSSVVATGADDIVAVYALVGALVVQFPLLKLSNVDIDDFSTKDYLYVGFMTFSLWFVCWAIFLTTGTSL